MVYSRVTTSLMAERPFFFSPPFFAGAISATLKGSVHTSNADLGPSPSSSLPPRPAHYKPHNSHIQKLEPPGSHQSQASGSNFPASQMLYFHLPEKSRKHIRDSSTISHYHRPPGLPQARSLCKVTQESGSAGMNTTGPHRLLAVPRARAVSVP